MVVISPVIMKAIYATIDREGGEVNLKNDSGGHTNWGITEATARAWGYRGSMSDLQKATAIQIYLDEFVYKPKIDLILAVSTKVGEEVFDTGVNCGRNVASRFLQRSLNVLNLQAKLYPDLVVDGYIGNVTRDALVSYLKHRGADGEVVLLRMLNSLQGAYYVELAERREKDETFIFGWFLHRVAI